MTTDDLRTWPGFREGDGIRLRAGDGDWSYGMVAMASGISNPPQSMVVILYELDENDTIIGPGRLTTASGGVWVATVALSYDPRVPSFRDILGNEFTVQLGVERE